MMQAEILRRLGKHAVDDHAFPTLPAGYDLHTLEHRWNSERDTLLIVKPGSTPSDAGEIRYQFLR